MVNRKCLNRLRMINIHDHNTYTIVSVVDILIFIKVRYTHWLIPVYDIETPMPFICPSLCLSASLVSSLYRFSVDNVTQYPKCEFNANTGLCLYGKSYNIIIVQTVFANFSSNILTPFIGPCTKAYVHDNKHYKYDNGNSFTAFINHTLDLCGCVQGNYHSRKPCI